MNWTQSIACKGGYDVIIIGGGIAGVSAALQARRDGHSVLLVEKQAALGGLATLGMITKYLPLCDGKGRQLTTGIPEELLRLSFRYGYNDLPKEWSNPGKRQVKTKKRYLTHYNAPAFMLAMDELLTDEGVTLLFDTVFLAVSGPQDSPEGVVLHNHSGLIRFDAQIIIDASGDASVFRSCQSDVLKGGNFKAQWALTTSLKAMKMAVRKKDLRHGVELMRSYTWNTLADRSVEGFGEKGERETFDFDDPFHVTKFILKCRKMLLNLLKDTPVNQSCILSIPTMPDLRTICCIEGEYVFTEHDIHKRFDDSIGCVGDPGVRGSRYEIPYRSMVQKKIRNVIAAGRCSSASGYGWDITRLIPGASATGQAAGAAAGIAIASSLPVSDISIIELQNRLIAADVQVHIDD